jgi:hypothetical protein
MKERPIIFSTEMVQKILSDTKTQTRRVIKPQPHYFKSSRFNGESWEFSVGGQYGYDMPICPFGQVGDRLWVREAWCKNVQPAEYNINDILSDIHDEKQGTIDEKQPNGEEKLFIVAKVRTIEQMKSLVHFLKKQDIKFEVHT